MSVYQNIVKVFSLLIVCGWTSAIEARETRIVVGFAAGAVVDLTARQLAQALSDSLGEIVIVDNKAGAGQRLAIIEVKRAAADGRTLLLATSSSFSITPTIYGQKAGYDPVKDFTPIARIAKFENGLAISGIVKGSSFSDFLVWAKANPKEAAYASPGAGTIAHLIGVLLAENTKLPLTHIPYRGAAPAITDLLGNHIPLLVTALPDLVEHERAGKIKVIAVTGSTRTELLPHVPTLKELGTNIVADIGIDIYGPAGMSPELVARLNSHIEKIVKSDSFQSMLKKSNMSTAFYTPAELAAVTAAERAMWEHPIKASGFTGE